MSDDNTTPVVVNVHNQHMPYLEALARSQGMSIGDVFVMLAMFAADGMRRPGAWERVWLDRAFESSWLASMEQVPDVPYAQLRPKQ